MEAGIPGSMGDAEDDRHLLIERISREEARLAEIELTRSDSEKRLSALRSQLTSLESEEHPAGQQGVSHPPRSSAEKVELFRTLLTRPNRRLPHALAQSPEPDERA